MKRITTFCALALLALGALTACNEQSVHLDPAANIFDGANVYFESGSTENLSAKIALDGSISEVACGRTKAASGEYSYSDGVLTLAGNFIKAITGSGEKTVTVTTSSGKKALNALVCTKVISTADQFQAINTDAASLAGTYVLANDIDLTSIDNFEPLGWYVSEQDPNNAYFHGILEGNGHTIKNGKVYYSDSVASNYNVYSESGTRFSHAGHINGDNIGLFQVIGSSGIVRNVNFSNIKVRGRTIVGVIAGNVMLMGGSIGFGNVSPAAEFNILVDPEAADIVFRSGLSIYMNGLDVTRKALVLPEIIKRIERLHNRASKLFVPLMKKYNENQKKIFSWNKGGPLHDPVTIVSLLDPSIITYKYMVSPIKSSSFSIPKSRRGMLVEVFPFSNTWSAKPEDNATSPNPIVFDPFFIPVILLAGRNSAVEEAKKLPPKR